MLNIEKRKRIEDPLHGIYGALNVNGFALPNYDRAAKQLRELEQVIHDMRNLAEINVRALTLQLDIIRRGIKTRNIDRIIEGIDLIKLELYSRTKLHRSYNR